MYREVRVKMLSHHVQEGKSANCTTMYREVSQLYHHVLGSERQGWLTQCTSRSNPDVEECHMKFIWAYTIGSN